MDDEDGTLFNVVKPGNLGAFFGGSGVDVDDGRMEGGDDVGGCEAMSEPVTETLLLPSSCGIVEVFGGPLIGWHWRFRLACGVGRVRLVTASAPPPQLLLLYSLMQRASVALLQLML